MGNQACAEAHSIKNPCCEEPSQNLSLIDINNPKISNEDNYSRFSELPTLGEENCSSHLPKYQEVHHTSTQVSVAKNRGHQMTKSNSFQVSLGALSERNSKRPEERIKIYNHDRIDPKNDYSTYRSERSASITVRQHPSHVFSEYNKETNREHKVKLSSESNKRMEISHHCKTSRNCKENMLKNENRNDGNKKQRKLFEIGNSTNLERNLGQQSFYVDRPENVDPIAQFLKKFPGRNVDIDQNETHCNLKTNYYSAGNVETYSNLKKDSVSENKLNYQSYHPNRRESNFSSLNALQKHVPDQIIRESTNEDRLQSGVEIKDTHFRTISSSNSPRTRVTSENILSEPDINQTSQLILGTKRLWNYDLPIGINQLNLKLVGAEGHGSKNFTSITEFDHEKYFRQHVAEGFSNDGSSLIENGTHRKRNSGTLNSVRFRTNSATQEDAKGIDSLERLQEPEPTNRSGFSNTSSSIPLVVKKDTTQNIKKLNPSRIGTVKAVSNPRLSLKSVPEKTNQDETRQAILELNEAGRISTVAECFKEAELSFDSLNRTGELSMMSPNNIESTHIIQIPPARTQKRSPSPPERPSLRQFVLSKALEKAHKTRTEVGKILNNNKSNIQGGFVCTKCESISQERGIKKISHKHHKSNEQLPNSQNFIKSCKQSNDLKQRSNKDTDTNLKTQKGGKYDERSRNERNYVRRFSQAVDYSSMNYISNS